MPESKMSYVQTMSFCLILCILFSDSVFTASLPQHPENISDLAAKPISSTNLLSPTSILASSSNLSSSENLLKIGCDARTFGKNLKVQSCRNLFQWMHKDDRQFEFAQRDSGLPADVSLPLRTLSSKTLAERSTFRYNAPCWPANTAQFTLTHARKVTDYASSSQSLKKALV